MPKLYKSKKHTSMRSTKTKTHTRNTSNKFRKNKSLRGGFQDPPPPSYNNTRANNQRMNMVMVTFINAFFTNANDAFKKIGFGTYNRIDYSDNNKITHVIEDAIQIINRMQRYDHKEFIYSLFIMLFKKISASLPPPYTS